VLVDRLLLIISLTSSVLQFCHLAGNMSDLLISIAINVIKGFVFLYDVVTYIPRYVIEQPYKKLALSSRLRVGTSHDQCVLL